jgi:hypothetical protein
MHRAPKPPLTIGPPTSLYRSTPPSLTPTRSAPHPPTCWRGVASREPHPVLCFVAMSLARALDEPPHSRAAQECAPQPPSVQLQHTRACSARRNHPVTALARTHGKLHSGQSARRGTHEGERSSQALPSIDGEGQYKTEKDAPSIEKEQQGATSLYTLPLFFGHQGQLVDPVTTADHSDPHGSNRV